MRAKDIIGLAIALVLAIAVALVTRFFLTRQEKPKQEVIVQKPQTTQILIAKNELKEGSTIQSGDLAWQEWPLSSVNQSYVTAQVLNAHSLKPEDLIGAVVRTPIMQGEPVVIKDFVKQGDRSILAALLTPGKRAISIDVSSTTASSGLINPGDMIDVILTFSATAPAGSATQQIAKSKTLLKEIKVLAIDTALSNNAEKVNASPRVATLEVTPAQAEIITSAAKEGTLSLSLHSLATDTNAPPPDEALEKNNPTDVSIVIMRGKDTSTVSFDENN